MDVCIDTSEGLPQLVAVIFRGRKRSWDSDGAHPSSLSLSVREPI